MRAVGVPFARFKSIPKASAAVPASLPPSGRWQLLAYDIVCPKRIARVSYRLKKIALHTQYSLFLMQLNGTALRRCIGEIECMLGKDDDLRVYSIDQPDALWQFGASRTPGLLVLPDVQTGSMWEKLRLLLRPLP
jgi:CRISPR-associated endonuclease Cas2